MSRRQVPFKRNLPQMIVELLDADFELDGEVDEATELWNLW